MNENKVTMSVPSTDVFEKRCYKFCKRVEKQQTHALVEHVGFVPESRVLTQMLLNPLDPLHLQLLQLLQKMQADHLSDRLTRFSAASRRFGFTLQTEGWAEALPCWR